MFLYMNIHPWDVIPWKISFDVFKWNTIIKETAQMYCKHLPVFSTFGKCRTSYTQSCEIPRFGGQIGIDKILCPREDCSWPDT